MLHIVVLEPARTCRRPAVTALLVCATRPGHEPVVVLADGSYDAGPERVFWRSRPEWEVLRLPASSPVSVRPLQQRPAPALVPSLGEQLLAEAVRAHLSRLIPRPRPAQTGRHVREALVTG